MPRPSGPKRAGRGRGLAGPAQRDAPPRRARACAVHTNRPRAPRREVRGLRGGGLGGVRPCPAGPRARGAPGGKPGVRSGVRALWGLLPAPRSGGFVFGSSTRSGCWEAADRASLAASRGRRVGKFPAPGLPVTQCAP